MNPMRSGLMMAMSQSSVSLFVSAGGGLLALAWSIGSFFVATVVDGSIASVSVRIAVVSGR